MRTFEPVSPEALSRRPHLRSRLRGRLVGLLLAWLAAAPGPAGAQPEASAALAERLPSGGDAYLEIRDLGAALERLGRSRAAEAARTIWGARESAPLRIAGGVAQGVSGLSPEQMLAALEGCQIVAGRYAATEAGLVVIRGERPGLRRLLSVFERFAAPPDAGPARGIEPAIASRRSPWVVRQEQGLWMAASSPELAAQAAAPRHRESSAWPPARAGLGGDVAWLWWAEGAGLDPSFFDGLERWLGISGAGWARTRERLERGAWNAAALRLEDTVDPAGGLRATLRLIAPGSAKTQDRWLAEPTSPDAQEIRADESTTWEHAARTLARSASRLEVRRREGPLVELTLSLVFDPLPESPTDPSDTSPAGAAGAAGAPGVSPGSEARDSASGSRVPPGRQPAGTR